MADEQKVVVDLATVEERETGLKSRTTRQDDDLSNYYNLSPYQLKDHKNVQVVGQYPVTSNRSRVFADRVISALQGSKIKCDVTIRGKTGDKTKKIEDALAACRQAIDLYLSAMGFPSLIAFMSGQVAVRGGVALLVYPYADPDDKDLLIPHVGLWDWRYVASSLGRDGLEWASHRMEKSRAQVMKEHGISTESDPAKVVDVWYPGKHDCYIDEQIGNADRETGLEYTPVVESLCNLTAFVQDSGYEEYMGESVWASLRDTYTERNRQLSIRNTLAMKSAVRSMQYRSNLGEQAAVDAKNAFSDHGVHAVEKDGGYDLMPVQDINQAAIEMLAKLEEDVQYAGLPLIEYGEMPQDMTAAQLNTVLSKTLSFLYPRRRAIEIALDEWAWMFLLQLRDRKLPRKVVIKHRTIQIPDVDLDQDVEIKHELCIELPQQAIANYTLNAAARGEVSQLTRLRDILRVEDPEGEVEALRQEALMTIDPRLAAFVMVADLLDSKDPDKVALGAYAVRLLQLQMPTEQPQQGGQIPPVEAVPPPGQGQQGAPPAQMAQAMAQLQGQRMAQRQPVPGIGQGELPAGKPPQPDTTALPALMRGGGAR